MGYAECDYGFETVYFYLVVAFFVLLFISTFVVFINKDSEGKKISVLNEMLGPFYTLFSRRYLNSVGRKWWPLFVLSWPGFVALLLAASLFGICQPLNEN